MNRTCILSIAATAVLGVALVVLAPAISGPAVTAQHADPARAAPAPAAPVKPSLLGVEGKVTQTEEAAAIADLTCRSPARRDPRLLGVGEVRQSLLRPMAFRALNGDCWVPLAGQEMKGTPLARLYQNSNLPDARGIFLRSFNDGRQGGGNPHSESNPNKPDEESVTDQPVGTPQADVMHSHRHVLNQKIGTAGIVPQNPSTKSAYIEVPEHGYTETGSQVSGEQGTGFTRDVCDLKGDETRPRCVIVYTYINVGAYVKWDPQTDGGANPPALRLE
jgi:hypothetical protein